jgi:hypothetical protein
MDYNGLIWIIKAYGPGRMMVFWAFSPGEAISILEELRDNYDDLTLTMELTSNPNENGLHQ